MPVASTVVSHAALAVAVLSLIVSALNFYLSGPAVRATCIKIVSPTIDDSRHMTVIKLSATGRYGVAVESIHFGAAHKPTQPFRKNAIFRGPALPHRIEGSSSQRWYLEGAEAMRVYNDLYPNNNWTWEDDFYIIVRLGNRKVIKPHAGRSIHYLSDIYVDIDFDQPPWD
jgi:hypothetical protein